MQYSDHFEEEAEEDEENDRLSTIPEDDDGEESRDAVQCCRELLITDGTFHMMDPLDSLVN